MSNYYEILALKYHGMQECHCCEGGKKKHALKGQPKEPKWKQPNFKDQKWKYKKIKKFGKFLK